MWRMCMMPICSPIECVAVQIGVICVYVSLVQFQDQIQYTIVRSMRHRSSLTFEANSDPGYSLAASIGMQRTYALMLECLKANWHKGTSHLGYQSDIQVVHRYPHSGLESVVESASRNSYPACLWSNSEYQSHPISCTSV